MPLCDDQFYQGSRGSHWRHINCGGHTHGKYFNLWSTLSLLIKFPLLYRYLAWYSPVCYSIWLNSATSEGLASQKSPLRGKPICNINLRVLFRSFAYYVCMFNYIFAHICMPNCVCMCTIIVYLVYNHIGIAHCYHLLRIIFCINFFIRFCYECLST